MKKLETQIRHLEKEIKTIKENEIDLKKREKDILDEYKNSRKLLPVYKERYFELLDEYDASKEVYFKYTSKRDKIKEDVNSKIWFFKKSYHEIDFPEDLEKLHKSAYRKLDEIKWSISKLNEEFYRKKFSTAPNPSGPTDRIEVTNHFDAQLRSLNNTIEYYDDRLKTVKVNEEYEKKKRALERLNKQLLKRNKDKTFANAYLNKNRVDASTIKLMLKQLEECPYCGSNAQVFEADHIFPVSLGGLSIKENMINVCKACNRNKGGLTLREFIKKFKMDRNYIEDQLEGLGKKF